MIGEPARQLAAGYSRFIEETASDPLARKRVEMAVVAFSSTAAVVVPFQEARELKATEFQAGGSTNLAEGIRLALRTIDERKQEYKAEGIEYFRPWLFILSDGLPNRDGLSQAIAQLNEAEKHNRLTVFPVGVGDGADMSTLSRLSVSRDAVSLQVANFSTMFSWLSASLKTVSTSKHSGATDEISPTTAQIPLPPAGWANA